MDIMKRREFLQVASGAAACSVARFTQTRAQMTGFQGRDSLPLNGTWDFQMDPEDEGLTGKWFTTDASYSHRIEVPGCWQAQGFGPPIVICATTIRARPGTGESQKFLPTGRESESGFTSAAPAIMPMYS